MNNKAFFRYFVSSEIKQVWISIALLITLSVIFFVIYMSISSAASFDFIRTNVFPENLYQQSKNVLFDNYIIELRRLFLAEFRYVLLLVLGFALLAYFAESIISLMWSYVSSLFIIPRDKATLDHLEIEKTFEKKVFLPIIM